MRGTQTPVAGVDITGLRGWLVDRGLLRSDAVPLMLTKLAGGSNLTVRVQGGDGDWVLRRPPLRGVLPTAHDVLREHRLQAALAQASQQLPLASMVAACADSAVIGAPFYLMHRLTGRAHTAQSLATLTDEDVHAVGLALADTLAELHAVDPAGTPAMAEFVRPEPYAERQLRRWSGQWERARQATGISGDATLDRVFADLSTRRPPVPPARVVHGDYGLANVMFDPVNPTQVQAVLDWELATLGDPLADLGALVAYWSKAGSLLNAGREDPVCHPSLQPALPSVPELVERYSQRATEADPGAADAIEEHLAWYVSLAVARLAAIVAGALNRLDLDDPAQAARREQTITLIHELANAAEAELAGSANRVQP